MAQMINSQAAKSYGTVLYELQVPAADIFWSQDILAQCPELLKVLCCPAVASEQKLAVIGRAFPESMGNFMKSVCENGRCDILPDIFRAYAACADEQSQTLRAVLKCVTKPDERQKAGLIRFLCNRFGMKNVDLKCVIDKSLIGGFIIEAGGYEMDYSLKGRFCQLKKKLSGGE